MFLTRKDIVGNAVTALIILTYVGNAKEWWFLGDNRWAAVTMLVIGTVGCPLAVRLVDEELTSPAIVALGVLGPEEADEGLGDGETDGLAHEVPARRGSTCWSAHVARIQAWSGWSVIFQARSPGPAMTLR